MPLQYILFDTTLFDEADKVEQTRKDLCWLLEALTQRNMSYLSRRPETPRLYKSGVTYAVPNQHAGDAPEVKAIRDELGSRSISPQVDAVLRKMQQVFGGEHFCDIGRILELGKIDCDGLACYRAAELRQMGIPAKPYMTHRDTPNGTVYHALVLWPPMPGIAEDANGKPQWTSEDPSLLLGMGGERRAADRAEEIRKNKERLEHLQKLGGKLPVMAPSPSLPTLSKPSMISEIEDILGITSKAFAVGDSLSSEDLDLPSLRAESGRQESAAKKAVQKYEQQGGVAVTIGKDMIGRGEKLIGVGRTAKDRETLERGEKFVANGKKVVELGQQSIQSAKIMADTLISGTVNAGILGELEYVVSMDAGRLRDTIEMCKDVKESANSKIADLQKDVKDLQNISQDH
jgi:hypothetical protein